ncbi:MBL fold metallo-hydrolase [Brachybacterium hainanense]|uniref:Rhodanese-like domain-containing protein n=1 Tax=Brachybacterium hainanense TaxID=1541174 RepID=A0ABV6R7V1_9MICO
MLLERIYDTDLAQAGYLIGAQASGRALVVDARRDVRAVLDLAARHGLAITDVAETHIHADYLSGTRELAAATGARIHVSGEGGEEGQYGFDAARLHDGDEIDLGDVRVRALHTPGHTPEHLSFLVTDLSVADEPGYLLSGDFVFAGELGRPDLLDEIGGGTGTREESARAMFASLRDRFVPLPDWVQVLPGHGAGSACGKAPGAVPQTTVGYERRFAWWAPLLAADDEDAFVDRLLHGQPEPHAYFSRMKRQNRLGPAVRGHVAPPAPLAPAEAAALLARGEAVLLDTRGVEAVHERAIPGALHVPAAASRSTFAAWVYDPDHEDLPILLLAQDGAQAAEFADNLLRVGIDEVAGYITAVDGLPAAVPPMVDPAELATAEHVLLLDVRSRGEHEAGRIPGAVQLHGGRVLWELDRLPREGRILVHCQSGLRAAVVASALRRAGFDVAELAGSYAGWLAHTADAEAALTADGGGSPGPTSDRT